MNISVGQQFPSFSGRTYDGQYFNLENLAGKNVVIYFYPKDDTPGCACEAEEFSLLFNQFQKANTEVLGISVDSLDSHQKFSQKLKLKVPLISDAQKELVQKLGIQRASGSASRVTFVLNKEGKVFKIYENVNPRGHAQEVLSYIKENLSEAVSKKQQRLKEGGRERVRKIKV
ncbi:peroxiredoxin [Candidatus Parcubacteria bacterium]|nr:MAG: peroxiredoxin [Candidatus Parcubacteria bacterium]